MNGNMSQSHKTCLVTLREQAKKQLADTRTMFRVAALVPQITKNTKHTSHRDPNLLGSPLKENKLSHSVEPRRQDIFSVNQSIGVFL